MFRNSIYLLCRDVLPAVEVIKPRQIRYIINLINILNPSLNYVIHARIPDF